jgi:class 3 adenylate cyclase
MIAVGGFYGSRHLRDVAKIFAIMEDGPAQRARSLRRIFWVLAATVPIFSAIVLLPDPWPSAFVVELLDDPQLLTKFDAKALSAIAEERWRPSTPAAVKRVAFGREVVILRARIPPSSHDVAYVARTLFPTIASLDFLLTLNGREVERAAAGLERPLDAATYRSLFFSFNIPVVGDGERVVYTRLESDGMIDASLEILSERDFNQHNTVHMLLVALTVGAFLGIMIYNLLLSISIRERIYAYYLVYQLVMLAFTVVYSGLIWAAFPVVADLGYVFLSYLQYFLLILMVPPVVLFYSDFIAAKANFPWGYRGMVFLARAPIVLIPIAMTMRQGYCNILTLSFLGVAIVVGFLPLLPMINYRFVFLGVLSLLGLSVSTGVHMLSVIALVPSNFIVELLYAFGALWEALFLSMAIGEKIRSMRETHASIADAMSEGMAPSRANQILGRAFSRNYVPREWSVSILFISIPDFARYGDKIPMAILHRLVAREMRAIEAIIKAHGGIIDRSLGDGVLCYFGHEEIGLSARHARQAFEAARKIQERAVLTITPIADGKRVIFPMRIGINAESVLVANLSDDRLYDFTMIGSGVNLASRLNAACGPFRILTSESFRNAVEGVGGGTGEFTEIFVSVKHRANLVRAYEVNPHERTPSRLEEAERAYFDLMDYSRKESRQLIRRGSPVGLSCELGEFRLSDFSFDGLGLVGPVLVSQQAVLHLAFALPDHERAEELARRLLGRVQVEVRWSRSKRGEFMHGVRYIGLNREQKDVLFQFLTALYRPDELSATANAGEREVG